MAQHSQLPTPGSLASERANCTRPLGGFAKVSTMNFSSPHARAAAGCDFLTTVQEIERLTGLTFSDSVREADINRGEARRTAAGAVSGRASRLRAVTSFEQIGMGRVGRVRKSR